MYNLVLSEGVLSPNDPLVLLGSLYVPGFYVKHFKQKFVQIVFRIGNTIAAAYNLSMHIILQWKIIEFYCGIILSSSLLKHFFYSLSEFKRLYSHVKFYL